MSTSNRQKHWHRQGTKAEPRKKATTQTAETLSTPVIFTHTGTGCRRCPAKCIAGKAAVELHSSGLRLDFGFAGRFRVEPL